MVTKELSEAAVEFNTILKYTSEEIKRKIPKKFLDFLTSIQSHTYKFEYDKTKKLNEQNLKSKTRGLIALVYKDYICDENKRKEYIQMQQDVIKLKEEEKRRLYNPNEVFKSRKIENNRRISNAENNVSIIQYKDSRLKRIIGKIKKIFGY